MKNRFRNGVAGAVCAVFVAMGYLMSTGCAGLNQANEEEQQRSENEQNSQKQEPFEEEIQNSQKQEPFEEEIQNSRKQESFEEETEKNGSAGHNIAAAGEEKQFSPVKADGYTIDLPESKWVGEPNLWRAADNEQIHIWTAPYVSREEAEQILGDVGYVPTDSDMQKTESGLRYHVRIKEAIEGVWCLFYRYPEEMQDIYAGELSKTADTFAVTAKTTDQCVYGYITEYDGGSVTVDQKKWVTAESREWNDSYDQDAGFAIVDIDSEDAAYALAKDCTFSVLENRQGPAVDLDRNEFETYEKDAKNPILWVMELEDGQIIHIAEQYIP